VAGWESVTIDRLASWLNALGRDVEIIVKASLRGRRQGRLRVIEAAQCSRSTSPAEGA
jgi:hypothetical protein